jgi:ATP-dependent protease ClpP protease subunit
MSDQNVMLFPQKSRITTNSRSINTHIIKLWDDISFPSDYQDEIDLIDSATEDDVIVLDICTDGGVLDTAMLFFRSLRSTAAHTVAVIGPSCSSAGSVIALSCREFVLDTTSSLMLHTSTYGLGRSKDTDIYEHANFSRKQLKSFYEEVYSGFITEEELSDVIKGTPFYFTADELVGRLDNLAEYRLMLEEEGCGNEDCQDCSAPPQASLDDIISSAVEQGIGKAMEKVLKKFELVPKEVKPKVPSKKTQKALEEAKGTQSGAIGIPPEMK